MTALHRRSLLQTGLAAILSALSRQGRSADDVTPLDILWMGSSTTSLLVRHLDEIVNARSDARIQSHRGGGYFRIDYLSRWQAEENEKEFARSMTAAHQAIQSQKFDIVAFQLSYGIFSEPEKTEKHVESVLDEVCRHIVHSGAVPMIFDHWSPQPERMRKYCRDAVRKHQGKVAYCGSAINQIGADRGKEYVIGGGHANFRGNYLMACVVYATVTGRSPVGLPTFKFPLPGKSQPRKFQELSAAETLYLQEQAWQTQQQFAV